MVKLYGTWTLRAIGNDAGWKQRITIAGSVANNGPVEMVIGTTVVDVVGNPIVVTAQAFNPNTNTWIESLVRESMNWTASDGVQVQIEVDDNPPHGDLDFNDLVVLCTSKDPQLASPIAGPRPDLTLPEGFVRGNWRPGGPDRPGRPPRPVKARQPRKPVKPIGR